MDLLLVEDDPSIVDVVMMVLTHHDVRVVSDAAAAFDLVRARAPEVLLTDLNLAGALDGIALSKALRADLPKLGVVYMSGSLEDDAPPPDGVAGAVALPKPFRRAALEAAVTRAAAQA